MYDHRLWMSYFFVKQRSSTTVSWPCIGYYSYSGYDYQSNIERTASTACGLWIVESGKFCSIPSFD